MTKIAILGAGSWGTALAVIFARARKPHEISLWVHSAAQADSLHRKRENKTYLPGVSLPATIQVTHNLPEALSAAHIIVGAVPSVHARSIYSQALAHVTSDTIVVSATKGLEPATHLRMSKVILQCIAQAASTSFSKHIAVLSGPSFAMEAARGEPTAVVLAAEDAAVAAELQEEFAAPSFRLYTNDDVLGVELAGAMKNVIAIAAGVCTGIGLGFESPCGAVTRGLAEMTRLAVALGARPETLAGLAGLGDLVLTSTGSLAATAPWASNLAKAASCRTSSANMRMVAEGVGTAAPLLALAREHQIEMPITEQVDAILTRASPPKTPSAKSWNARLSTNKPLP